ncbi:MAG: bifunctional riboflavin kinase/FAD synthetase [Nitrospirota bacterium]
MKLIDGIENVKQKLPYPVLTLGNFDGVHLGHQEIFRMLLERAKEKNGTSVVFTFVPHPLSVIAPERAPKLLTTYKDKIKQIKKYGIDVVICVNFTKEFATLKAEDFVKDVLCKIIEVKEIFIGANYLFGKGRKGSPELLKHMGKEYGFTVSVVDEIKMNDITFSSSKIRKLVSKGKVDEASKFLGRLYSVEGVVISGAQRGKSLLKTPTANLSTANELLPKDGVYAVTVEIDGKTYGGATNIGYNPTFKEKKFSFESHVLDFDGELLGRILKVNFIKRIRDEMKFSGANELGVQLKQDLEDIRQVIKEYQASGKAGKRKSLKA